jgi:hypothetical protein
MLHLKNTSDRYMVYKIKTTRPEQYLVKPFAGVVQPRSVAKVQSECLVLQTFASVSPPR